MAIETYHCRQCGKTFTNRPDFCPNCESEAATKHSPSKPVNAGQQVVEYGLYLVIICFIGIVLMIGGFAFLVSNLTYD